MRIRMAVLIVLLLIGRELFSIDVQEIVNKANHTSYYQGRDGRAQVDMEITTNGKSKRVRKFYILRRNVDQNRDGDQKFYVYFTKPADVSKTVFLVWKHIDKDDDRWLYLPALDLVKRISASDKRTSFVGSTFFYEDVSGRNPNEDNHKLLQVTDNYFVVKSEPKDSNSVEFSYYKNWIHKKTFIPVKSEFYDKSGKLYRVYEALKVKKIQGYPTVVSARMKDLQSNTATIVNYKDVQYNIGLPDDIFTERYLRRPPRKYFK